jgi:periplasmic protein TonB
MPDVPHHDPAQTAAHDANGAVKMQTDINDHLDRLFAADKAEIPWFISLYQNIHDLIKPEKLPPLEITSKPVAVKSIWGLYANDPKSWYISIAFQAALVLMLLFVFTTKVV